MELNTIWARIREAFRPANASRTATPEKLDPELKSDGPKGPYYKARQQYLLRLEDGSYYAGPGSHPDRPMRATNPRDAEHFGDRWAAVTAAAHSSVFANAMVVPSPETKSPANNSAVS